MYSDSHTDSLSDSIFDSNFGVGGSSDFLPLKLIVVIFKGLSLYLVAAKYIKSVLTWSALYVY